MTNTLTRSANREVLCQARVSFLKAGTGWDFAAGRICAASPASAAPSNRCFFWMISSWERSRSRLRRGYRSEFRLDNSHWESTMSNAANPTMR